MKILNRVNHYAVALRNRFSHGTTPPDCLFERYGEVVNQLDPYEKHLLGFVSETLDRLNGTINVVFDIGAFNGAWSRCFALHGNRKVIAFEPLPSMKENIARASASVNGLICLQQVACGDQAKIQLVNINKFEPASSLLKSTSELQREWDFTGSYDSIPVNVVRLDDYVNEHNLPQPDLIKIDVQGYENHVIAGAKNVLKKAKYVWVELNFGEFYEGSSDFESVYAALTSIGYKLIDCVDLIRSSKDHRLLYLDGIFERIST